MLAKDAFLLWICALAVIAGCISGAFLLFIFGFISHLGDGHSRGSYVHFSWAADVFAFVLTPVVIAITSIFVGYMRASVAALLCLLAHLFFQARQYKNWPGYLLSGALSGLLVGSFFYYWPGLGASGIFHESDLFIAALLGGPFEGLVFWWGARRLKQSSPTGQVEFQTRR